MDNAQKAIMIGVALFITIAVISAVLLVTGIGTDMMNNSNSQLQGVSASVSAQLLADYDAVELTGASVIATIKKFYDKPNFLLCVDNKIDGLNQKYYSTKYKPGSYMLEPSMDGSTNVGYQKADRKKYVCFLCAKVDNNPNEVNITGLSTVIGTNTKYMSYIIYQYGTDTMLGLYIKRYQ